MRIALDGTATSSLHLSDSAFQSHSNYLMVTFQKDAGGTGRLLIAQDMHRESQGQGPRDPFFFWASPFLLGLEVKCLLVRSGSLIFCHKHGLGWGRLACAPGSLRSRAGSGLMD